MCNTSTTLKRTIPDTAGTQRFAALAAVDGQYAAAFYLFLSLTWAEKVHACFHHVDTCGIDKARLLRTIRPWSHGEQVLVKAALDLFDPGCVQANRGKAAHLGEIANVLDDHNLRCVLTALQLARGDAKLAIDGGPLDDDNAEYEVDVVGCFAASTGA